MQSLSKLVAQAEHMMSCVSWALACLVPCSTTFFDVDSTTRAMLGFTTNIMTHGILVMANLVLWLGVIPHPPRGRQKTNSFCCRRTTPETRYTKILQCLLKTLRRRLQRRGMLQRGLPPANTSVTHRYFVFGFSRLKVLQAYQLVLVYYTKLLGSRHSMRLTFSKLGARPVSSIRIHGALRATRKPNCFYAL